MIIVSNADNRTGAKKIIISWWTLLFASYKLHAGCWDIMVFLTFFFFCVHIQSWRMVKWGSIYVNWYHIFILCCNAILITFSPLMCTIVSKMANFFKGKWTFIDVSSTLWDYSFCKYLHVANASAIFRGDSHKQSGCTLWMRDIYRYFLIDHSFLIQNI